MEYFVQILGVLAVLLTVYGCSQKCARSCCKAFSIKNLFMLPYYYVLGAHEAMYIEFLALFRNIATAYMARKIMTAVIITYVILVWCFFLYKEPETFISTFSAIGTSFSAMAGFYRHKIWHYRAILISGSSFWIIYFVSHLAWAGIAIESLLIVTLVLASMRDLGFIKPIKLRPAPASV